MLHFEEMLQQWTRNTSCQWSLMQRRSMISLKYTNSKSKEKSKQIDLTYAQATLGSLVTLARCNTIVFFPRIAHKDKL